MTRGNIFLLLLMVLTAFLAALTEGYFIDQPGTMDACYYYSGGLSLAQNRGLTEIFLWNYLDESTSLPHPSHLYWMPLPSILAALGMVLFHAGFRASQIPFLFLATFFPLLVYWLGKRISGSFRIAVVAGFFSVFSGFYTVFWMNTESFLTYAWIGGLTFLCISYWLEKQFWWISLGMGILCGLAHLTRADGIVFLALILWWVAVRRPLSKPSRILSIFLILGGYILVAGFWYVRNISLYHAVFPPGTTRTLWLTEYNDLFHFPISDITPQRFFSAGWSSLLSARWNALVWNVQTSIFVLGLVFLSPLAGWGFALLRRKTEIRISMAYFFLLLFVMTVVYPFQGERGGFFHSTSALLPLSAVAAAYGLERAVAACIRWRKWNPSSAYIFIPSGFIALALFSSTMIFSQRVIGTDPSKTAWSMQSIDYTGGISRLNGLVSPQSKFMVNNPPCFSLGTGYPSIPVPAADPSALLEAADHYGVSILILDSNAPASLYPLYTGEEINPRIQRIFIGFENGNLYAWFRIVPAR
jgi:4-amino-4-deoxy-L-arabinose transferase-like glycosyltransferase